MNGGTIENNAADYGCGGGLYVSSSEDLIIKKGEISQNEAADGLGGGLYFEGLGKEPADVRLKEVVVKENQARFGGAAVISGSCQVFSITEDTRTYENQALGDTEIPGLEARVSDEFLIRAQDVKLSDEFEADEASADGDVTLHRIEGEEGFYTLAYGGSSDFDGEAKGYYNRKSEDGIQRYILDDTLYYEDENISVSIQIEGTATVSDEEETYKATPSVAGSAKAKRGLVLEAVPMEHEQPEYEAAKAYAQETGGEEGMVSLSAMELKFSYSNKPLDVSDCSITARITPKEPVLTAARQAAAVSGNAAPEVEKGIELTALQGSGDELDELGTLMIGTDTKETPRLDVQVNNADRMLMVSAREASNPHFTVQYYANLMVTTQDSNGYLKIINTDNGGTNQGGKLPQNGDLNLPTTGLYIDQNNNNTISATVQLTELYEQNEYNYFQAPGLPYVNIFRGNGNYQANEVWVLKDGKDPSSLNREDWRIYTGITLPTELHFTNRAENADDTTILIKEGTVIRLVANCTKDSMNILLANNPREKYAIGDTIPGTLNNGMMESVAKLMPQIESMLPKLDSILTSLNNIVGDKSIPSTLHSIETTTANLAIVSSQMKGLMSKDIPQLTGKLNTIGDNFVAISGNLKEVDYSAIFQKVDATLANVKMITEKLNSKDNTIGLLFNDPALYNNLNATTENAASLLEDLKAHPKRYVHFSLFGKKDK